MKDKQDNRRNNLRLWIDMYYDGKVSKIGRPVTKRSNSFYYDLLGKKKAFGEKLAEKIEMELGMEKGYLDTQKNKINEQQTKHTALKIYSSNTIDCEFSCWSDFCELPNSKTQKELRTVVIPKDVKINSRVYGIEINNDQYAVFEKGTQILIDPDKNPENGNYIIISFNDNVKTIARYWTSLGELQIEPLQYGLPGSKTLENAKYTIHGVAIWRGKGEKI